MNLKKIIIIVILVATAISVTVGLYLYNKPHKDILGSSADIVVTDDQIFKAFETNETNAIKKYVTGDPIIQVSGQIAEITKNTDSTTTVIFQNKSKYNGNVSCTIIKSESEKLRNKKVGENTCLKGQCSGMQELIDKEIIFLRCVFVK